MIFGIAKEIKPQEGRVALLPRHIRHLARHKQHQIFVTRDAGTRSGFTDEDYRQAGARVLPDNKSLFERVDNIVKVKELVPAEFSYLRSEHAVLTNLHPASNPELVSVMLKTGMTGIALEDCQIGGSPNSAFAGEIGAYEGVRLCFSFLGGSGRHFIERHGEPPILALVLGLGHVGLGAVRVLTALGCRVIGFDIDARQLQKVRGLFAHTGFSAEHITNLKNYLADADIILNAVLWDKARKDHLIYRTDLTRLKKACAIVDVSCDRSGAIETSRPTTWEQPIYREEGIRHFCVDNLPGAVPAHSSAGYGDSILPLLETVGQSGALAACTRNEVLRRGLVCSAGTLFHEETARQQNIPLTASSEFLQTLP